ncbi:unnamed protein product [Sphenostylis stenocarpa]|uniref:Uncharacterized protein n=1 Tax=Sphenostylis stenocarpa TaxID=92480 RepID=A0AA86S306_9FABA|nr:unnamed protein product [Sphenostylis stenocarpa]
MATQYSSSQANGAWERKLCAAGRVQWRMLFEPSLTYVANQKAIEALEKYQDKKRPAMDQVVPSFQKLEQKLGLHNQCIRGSI